MRIVKDLPRLLQSVLSAVPGMDKTVVRAETPFAGTHPAGQHTHYRTCPLCEATCGLKIELKDGKITSIHGDQDDHFSRGYICPKAIALQDFQTDPDRIQVPLEKTATGWRQISWDEGIRRTVNAIVAARKQHGRNSFGLYLGNPNVHNLGTMLLGVPFMQLLKTRNRYSATSLDQLTHHMVALDLFGHMLNLPVPDLDRTDFLLVLGGNPLVSNGSMMTAPDMARRLKAIRQRGGRVVVVDPRCTETAEVADQHLFIRPGSDALLLLAMLNVIASEQLYSQTPDVKLFAGLQDWQPYVAAYPPERVSEATGISAEDIRQLARNFSAARQAVCYGRMGISTQSHAALAQYLVALLNIVTGRLDQPGGWMFPRPAIRLTDLTPPGHRAAYRSRVGGLPEFSGELPAVAMADEMLTPGPGQLRAFMLVAGNPVITAPDGDRLVKGLDQLDFMVALDFYINETSSHASIILPVATPLERTHYDLVFNTLAIRNTVRWSAPLFKKPGTVRHDWQILAEIALRIYSRETLHLPDAVTDWLVRLLQVINTAGVLDILLAISHYGQQVTLKKLVQSSHGIDLGPLQPALAGIVAKYGPVQLVQPHYLNDLKRLDQNFFENSLTPDDQFPLRLIGRRDRRSSNSWMHNSRRLMKGKNRCTLYMHPADASRIGLVDQQTVILRSAHGQLAVPLQITGTIMPGVVSVPHGWGHADKDSSWQVARQHAGINVNLLAGSAVDPVSGVAVLNGIPVQVSAASQATGGRPAPRTTVAV